MDILFVDGNNGNPESAQFSSEYQQKISEKGVKVKTYYLNELDIKQCRGCNVCMYQTPGRCAIEDDQEKILEDLIRAKLAVILAPICQGFIHSMTKRFLDRLFPLETPWLEIRNNKMHHRLRYSDYPGLGFVFFPEPYTSKEDIEINNTYAKLVGDYYAGLVFSRTNKDGLEVLVNETMSFKRLS